MAKTTYAHTCLYCKKFFTSHDSYRKFCNLSCSTANKNKLSREKKLQNYLRNPNRCIQCNNILEHNQRSNKFCTKSCAALYNNARKDYTKIKTGPEPGYFPHTHYEKHPPHTRVTQCIICSKYHPNKGKTCSLQCKSKLLSSSMKQAIFNGYDPKQNRGRHKQSWLESSFENWLVENKIIDFITEHPFRRHDQTKTYFADFYFPKINLIIELDGTQHSNTKEYDQQRDQYISERYNLEIIRISHKEYQQKTKLLLIQKKLGIE